MSDFLDLSGAHLLDLRRLFLRTPVEVQPIPSTATVAVHRTSPTGWTVAFAQFPTDGVLTVVTDPHGRRVVLADEADWVERPSQLADVRALHLLVRDYDADERLWFREPPSKEEWQQMVARTWARVERIHQIARSLPRLDTSMVSPAGTSNMRQRRQDRHNGRVEYANASLAWSLFSEEDAIRWQIAGFDEPRMARRFAQRDLAPEWSWPWFLIDVQPDVAVEADKAGWTPDDISALRVVIGETNFEDRFWPDHRKAWIRSGLPPRIAILACAAGLSAEEAPGMDLDESGLRTLAALRGHATNNLPLVLDTMSAMP